VDSTRTPEVLLEGGLSGLRLSRVLQSSFKVCLLAYLLTCLLEAAGSPPIQKTL
jgi:hypothetical protein